MVHVSPFREECIISMKESMRDNLTQNEIIKKMIKDYPEVHKSTFYDWYPVAKEQLEEDEEFMSGSCMIETDRQIKTKLKQRLIKDLENDYDLETDPSIKRNLRNDLLKTLKQF
tara:strand:- start:944 stop:1285 length:342 start_codon:yes stop_codon:yes gene_type:complete